MDNDPLLLTPSETQHQRNVRLWENPDHWQCAMYFCKTDSRLWVPKKRSRMSWGWTINFGHAAGPWVLIGFLVAVPLIEAIALGFSQYACKAKQT